ncbi:hypothetical protein AVEN_143406-1 [Araneus ventricosus]|uniref:Uncharacterized protein n=1 Tax=Araneus ventricosus TaxID=182803 RepID=A0A4Y2AES6_ARAVE|nr:hypothetical protein AVEN_143406-1 [Araneus ventricosus]
MQVHDTLSLSQPGYHDTAGHYPPRAIFGRLLLAPIVSTSLVRSHLKVHDTLSITHLCRAIFSCFGRIMQKIPSEDESDTLFLDGEVNEYSDQETDSEN